MRVVGLLLLAVWAAVVLLFGAVPVAFGLRVVALFRVRWRLLIEAVLIEVLFIALLA